MEVGQGRISVWPSILLPLAAPTGRCGLKFPQMRFPYDRLPIHDRLLSSSTNPRLGMNATQVGWVRKTIIRRGGVAQPGLHGVGRGGETIGEEQVAYLLDWLETTGAQVRQEKGFSTLLFRHAKHEASQAYVVSGCVYREGWVPQFLEGLDVDRSRLHLIYA